LPLLLVVVSLIHLTLLHKSGSTNPLGICAKMDVVRFYPKFIVKDIAGFLSIVGFLSLFTVFLYPNDLGHPDNYIKANSLVTPAHIVPEWYFLPFYAILRAIPNKLGGVIAMFGSILIMFILPFVGIFKAKSSKFVCLAKFIYWLFISNVLILTWLGACAVENPYIIISQIATIFYFSYFLFFLPLLS
jgi:ubiquinol-cytochrome c reductase cytochrome b subunit